MIDVTHMRDLDRVAQQVSSKIRSFKKPVIVYLQGQLGAGKTTFVKQCLGHLGYSGMVTSPTFAIINEYDAQDLRVAHIDLYRVSDPSELELMGLDLIMDQNDLVFVEWPDTFGLKPDLVITLTYSEKGRFFQVDYMDD